MELRDYLRILRRRWLLITLTTLLCLGAAAAVTASMTPVYEASSRLFVSTAQSDTTGDAYQGGLFSAQRVTSYANLVSSRETASRVADELGLDVDPDRLVEDVTAEVQPETVLLQINARSTDPELAQALASAYADELTVIVRELETPTGGGPAPIRASVYDRAPLPEEPVSPQPVRNMALALALGLLLGVGLAVVRELLDTTITSPEGVEGVTTAPLMGAISFDSATAKRPLITALEPHAPRVEAFRVLRTNMQFVDVDSTDKVYVVTSSLPSEGKTTTACNLAITLTQAGNRVALVECDLRRPKVAGVLDLDSAIGVTTILVGKVSVDDAVQKHGETGLEVITSGPIPPNPAELLQSQSMAQLLTELRERYDIVILDAPPLLPVTDAALLTSQADGALVVVRHGKTTRDQLKGALERLEQVDGTVLGTVLNMVPVRRRQGGAGYGYGYGYGYGPEEAKKAAKSGGREGRKAAKRRQSA